MERLKVISDIAAFTQFSNTMSFIPSWNWKDSDSPTQSSRRYLGVLSFDNAFYTVYSLYGEKNDKYITSLYYDLNKERKIYKSIIFTNNIEKILYHKKTFIFCDDHLYLIEYNDFNKRIIRNYDKIRSCIYTHLSKNHKVEYTNFRHMDFLVDNELYFKMMIFLDINQIHCLSDFIDINPSYSNKMYFICFEEHKKYLKDLIRDCHILIIKKSMIEEFLEKDYIEYNGYRIDCPSE